jgi:hypothetical protein
MERCSGAASLLHELDQVIQRRSHQIEHQRWINAKDNDNNRQRNKREQFSAIDVRQRSPLLVRLPKEDPL